MSLFFLECAKMYFQDFFLKKKHFGEQFFENSKVVKCQFKLSSGPKNYWQKSEEHSRKQNSKKSVLA